MRKLEFIWGRTLCSILYWRISWKDFCLRPSCCSSSRQSIETPICLNPSRAETENDGNDFHSFCLIIRNFLISSHYHPPPVVPHPFISKPSALALEGSSWASLLCGDRRRGAVLGVTWALEPREPWNGELLQRRQESNRPITGIGSWRDLETGSE